MSSLTTARHLATDTWTVYRTMFTDHLEAVNKADRTITTYDLAVEQLGDFLASQGMPTDPTIVTREHLTEWLRHMRRSKDEGGQGLAPASVLQRYRSISAFFKWLEETDEISESPMRRMKPPALPEQLVPVVGDDDLQKLFRAVAGRDFESRRDRAILSMFLDLGVRLSEMAGMTLDDVDLQEREVLVHGKGRRDRVLRFIKETRSDLQRYLLARAKHPKADEPWLWIGRRGRLGTTGIYQMLQRRCEEAGIAPIHPHQLRHTFAHLYRLNGGSEGDLMHLAGWRSPVMAARYGKSAASERARHAHDNFSPRKAIG